MLQSGDRSFFWKTAYEETLSEFSPGVQLVLQMCRTFPERRTFATSILALIPVIR
jgi:hypothetical protein